MLTDDALRLIVEMAGCTTKRDWERLRESSDRLGGVLATCSEKLLVLVLSRDNAASLATELLDHRARIAAVTRAVEEGEKWNQ